MRRVGVEQPVHDGGAARVGEQLALVADQAARRRVEHQPQAVAAGRLHLQHLGFAFGHLLHDDAGMNFVDVDDDFLDRLQLFACLRVLAQQHLRPRHRELEALAPHGLDQDAELQFAAAGDFHGILLVGFAHAQRHIAFRLAQQAVADHAAGDLAAFGAGER